MTAMFNKAFRDSRRTLIWLAVGLVIYTLFVLAFFPTLVAQKDELNDLMNSMPDAMISMVMGAANMDEFNLADPAVFLQGRITTWVILLVGALVIAQAFNAFTNAERDGSMDMLLSLPVSRRAMLIARALNTVALVLAVLTAVFLALLAGTFIWPEFDIAVGDLAPAIYLMFLPLMVIAGFAYMLTALIPSSKRYAGALAYLFMIGSYLIHSFAAVIEDLSVIRPLFLFDHYNAYDIVHYGPQWDNVLLLAAVALVYFGVAWWAVDRKELGV